MIQMQQILSYLHRARAIFVLSCRWFWWLFEFRARGVQFLGADVWFFFICQQETYIFGINHCLNQYHHFGVLNWKYFMILSVNVWQLCPFRQKLVRSVVKDAVVNSRTSSRFTLHSSRIWDNYIFKILTDSYMMWFM